MRSVGASLTAAALLSGCAPQTGTIVLELEHHMLGGDRLEVSTPQPTRYGPELAYDQLRYWLTNVELTGEAETVVVPDSYYLVEQTADSERTTVRVEGVPPGLWDELAFHIGVDIEHNTLESEAGELQAGIGMDWSFGTGFQFFRAQGSFATEEGDGVFAVQTGGDTPYKRLAVTLPTPVEIDVGDEVTFTVVGELDRLFAGVDLTETSEFIGGPPDSPAGNIAGNYARMFSLVDGEESVRMIPSSPNRDRGRSSPIPTDGTPPLLTETFVDLGDGLADLGQLDCSAVPGRPADDERACLNPFGLGDGTSWADTGHLSLVTANDAAVRAAAPGVVSAVTYTGHSDITHSDLFAVEVQLNPDSAFTLRYENLKGLTVEEGDDVQAGQRLGGAGDYVEAEYGLVGFAVQRQQLVVQRLCPTRYTTPEVAASYEGALAASNAAWPQLAADALCAQPAIVCTPETPCSSPADFEEAQGDVDRGRWIYAGACAGCHGDQGQGDIAGPLCGGPGCGCTTCGDHATLAARTTEDMPPEGQCDASCAADVAAFIFFAFPD